MVPTESLLSRAIKALQYADIKENEWCVGGGTVLAYYYDHRKSKDIDIFIHDAQLLPSLSPRFNDITDESLAYDEESKCISLAYPEGKIDFIAAGQLSLYTPHKENFFGHSVLIEDPVEIVTKKMFFRGMDCLTRDIYDLAVVYHSDRRNDLVKTFRKFPEKVQIFRKALWCKGNIDRNLLYSVMYKENLLPGNVISEGKELDICMALLDQIYEPEKT